MIFDSLQFVGISTRIHENLSIKTSAMFGNFLIVRYKNGVVLEPVDQITSYIPVTLLLPFYAHVTTSSTSAFKQIPASCLNGDYFKD